ncbi:hypothetical protein OH492_05035 [Vibrio chagasii]|nr:hypothetical protein [Vibrio chagasii]
MKPRAAASSRPDSRGSGLSWFLDMIAVTFCNHFIQRRLTYNGFVFAPRTTVKYISPSGVLCALSRAAPYYGTPLPCCHGYVATVVW